MHFQRDKRLSELSTLGIGGPARYFLEIDSIGKMQEVMAYASKEGLPRIIIGKGSNTLFDDRGFDGLVILNKIAFCDYRGGEVEVGAGYSFSLLGTQTARKKLSGLEFASGIPGSVGGAVYMNAGANGKETADALKKVSYVDEEGKLLYLDKEELTFAYRYSSFQKKNGAIVAALFSLSPSEGARQKQLKIIDYRTKTQPYSDKSAGCAFRNPSLQQSAGSLIDRAGLKGVRVGGAAVSDLHANFIVNASEATARDILELIALVQEKVRAMTGIELEMEIRTIPYEPII
jgi:UDP-N-acetylmuramate dehydrogenase